MAKKKISAKTAAEQKRNGRVDGKAAPGRFPAKDAK